MDNTQRLGIELRRLFLDTTTDNNADVLAVYDRGYNHGYKAALLRIVEILDAGVTCKYAASFSLGLLSAIREGEAK